MFNKIKNKLDAILKRIHLVMLITGVIVINFDGNRKMAIILTIVMLCSMIIWSKVLMPAITKELNNSEYN